MRGEMVHPAFVPPFAGVGVQRQVLIEAGDGRRIAGSPDTERVDAEAHPGLHRVHSAIKLANEEIDVVATPITARQRAAPALIALPRRVIGKGNLAPSP